MKKMRALLSRPKGMAMRRRLLRCRLLRCRLSKNPVPCTPSSPSAPPSTPSYGGTGYRPSWSEGGDSSPAPSVAPEGVLAFVVLAFVVLAFVMLAFVVLAFVVLAFVGRAGEEVVSSDHHSVRNDAVACAMPRACPRSTPPAARPHAAVDVARS